LNFSIIKYPFSALLLFGLTLSGCADNNPYKQGELHYKQHCANCHGDQGQGLGALIPPLAQSDYLTAHTDELACLILKGNAGDTMLVNGILYAGQSMPGNKDLSPIEIANILNYIGHSWGNRLPEFQLAPVREQLSGCE
jgi:mono/diheme cytochrome c family protein